MKQLLVILAIVLAFIVGRYLQFYPVPPIIWSSLHWQTLASIAQIVLALFAFVTLWFFIRQTKATTELVKNELRPNAALKITQHPLADRMPDSEVHLGTRFVVFNLSKFPVLIRLAVVLLEIEGKNYGDSLSDELRGRDDTFRVEPWSPHEGVPFTAPYSFLADVVKQNNLDISKKRVDMQVRLMARPVFRPDLDFFDCDFRSMRFEDLQWIDNKWGMPDSLF